MKIALVSKYFFPHRGGIESHVQGVAEEFVKKGHQVTVYAANDPETKNEEIGEGIRIVRFGVWFTLFNGPFTPGMFLKLLQDDYDLLHIHLPDPANSVFAFAAAKLRGKQFYVTYHADILKDEWYQKPFTLTYRLLQYFILWGAERIIATTPNYVAKSQIPERFKEKTEIVPNFVDAQRFNPGISGSRIRSEYNLEGKEVILFLGRLVPYKGVKYIISAFGKAKKEEQDSVLIVAGKGPLGDELKKQVKDEGIEDVLFLEPGDEEVPEFYAACDFFAMPSVTRQEAFGIALLEAMACGKATITTTISGMPYVVGDAGLKVEPENVEELARAMSILLSDEKLRSELGEKGRKRVEELFRREVVAEKILEIYEEK